MRCSWLKCPSNEYSITQSQSGLIDNANLIGFTPGWWISDRCGTKERAPWSSIFFLSPLPRSSPLFLHIYEPFIWLTGSIATRPFPLKIFFLKPWRFNEKHFHILFTKRITLEFMTRLVYQWEANTSQSITEKCFITFQVNGVLDEWFTSRNKINCYNLFHLQNLQRLEVTYLSFIGPPLIVKIVHSLPHLRSLNLRMTPTTDEVKSLLSQSFAQEAHDIL